MRITSRCRSAQRTKNREWSTKNRTQRTGHKETVLRTNRKRDDRMLILITGGSGSGKSAYAEQMVLDQGDATRYYIATMRPWDKECEQRIARHRLMRADKGFETIECYQDLHLLELEPDSVILLECMSNLTAGEFYREDVDWRDVRWEAARSGAAGCGDVRSGGVGCENARSGDTGCGDVSRKDTSHEDDGIEGVKTRIMRGILHLQKQAKALMIVTNEVFSDGVDYDRETRVYQQILGAINQELAKLADQVIEVVYGIPVIIRNKGERQ